MKNCKIVFMGTSEYAVPILQQLVQKEFPVVAVVTQPDRPSGRGRKCQSPPVKIEAEKLNIPIIQAENIRTPDFYDQLQALNPCLIITASFGKILKPRHLSIPLKGVLNVHASLLPKLRGAAPVQWAIIKGYPRTGVTIMRTEKGLDTGPVIAQKSVLIEPQITADVLERYLSSVGANLLTETISDYLIGTLKPIAQDDTQATYAPMIKKQDAQIDWTMSAEEIERRVRGFHPWPGAFTYHHDCRFKLVKAEVVDPVSAEYNPGYIIDCEISEGLFVQTGKGILLCREMQPASKRCMCADRLIAGRYMCVGDIFQSLHRMN